MMIRRSPRSCRSSWSGKGSRSPWDRSQEVHLFVLGQQADLVLLDLRPGGKADAGWRVLDQMALDPSTRQVPVVLWSGLYKALQAHTPALLPEHGVYLLPKPCDLETLLEVVREALTAHSTAAAHGLTPTVSTEHEQSVMVNSTYFTTVA